MIDSVSVILPTYNSAGVIGRAIGSALAQTREPHEIIVVDDASSDDTIELIKSQYGSHIRVVRHEYNRGAAAARNTGIRLSSSRYIALLDADDSWHESKLMEQLIFMQKAKLAISTTSFHFIGGDSTSDREPLPGWGTEYETSHRLVWGCRSSPGSTLMTERRCFTETVGYFDEKLRRLEDWDWLLRAKNTHSIAHLCLPLSTVFKTGTADFGDTIESLRAIQSKLPHYRIGDGLPIRKLKSTLILEQAAAFYRQGIILRAIGLVCKSFIIMPFRNKSFYAMLLIRTTDLLKKGKERSSRSSAHSNMPRP